MTTIEALIEKLQSIQEIDQAAIELISIGARAVPALRQFLLTGKPSTVFQPRMAAVEILGQIGAKNVLLEFLRTSVQTSDPAVRFGEIAVRSTAAREIACWPGDDVNTAIMDILRESPLPGACDAAGQLRLNSAAPYLVDALADDVSRPRAMDALRRIFPAASSLLIEATLLWLENGREGENPALYSRALPAARILSEADLSAEEAAKLDPLMESGDPEIVACVAGVQLRQPHRDATRIANALLGVLPHASCFVLIEIRDLFAACGPAVLGPLDAEIQRRVAESMRQPGPGGAHAKPDTLLPLLVNVRRRVAEDT
jgi:hypothetical protein